MKPPRRFHPDELAAWSLAWAIPISIGLGYALGWWLDKRFGTSPWLQIIGFILGTVAALVQVLQTARTDRKRH